VFTGDGRATGSSPRCTARLRQPADVDQPRRRPRAARAWITAACVARRGQQADAQERDNCLPWTVAELEHLTKLRVVVCLGAFAWDAALRLRAAAGHPCRDRGRASATRPCSTTARG